MSKYQVSPRRLPASYASETGDHAHLSILNQALWHVVRMQKMAKGGKQTRHCNDRREDSYLLGMSAAGISASWERACARILDRIGRILA